MISGQDEPTPNEQASLRASQGTPVVAPILFTTADVALLRDVYRTDGECREPEVNVAISSLADRIEAML